MLLDVACREGVAQVVDPESIGAGRDATLPT